MERPDTVIYSDCWLDLSEFINSLVLEFPDDSEIKDIQDLLFKIERKHFKEGL